MSSAYEPSDLPFVFFFPPSPFSADAVFICGRRSLSGNRRDVHGISGKAEPLEGTVRISRRFTALTGPIQRRISRPHAAVCSGAAGESSRPER
ncbi:hypothetical protein INR49_013735 [Caranx melampygus]|nr:hypothetical protein INR49_013735 [Caranx melampygus]